MKDKMYLSSAERKGVSKDIPAEDKYILSFIKLEWFTGGLLQRKLIGNLEHAQSKAVQSNRQASLVNDDGLLECLDFFV